MLRKIGEVVQIDVVEKEDENNQDKKEEK